MICSMTAFAEHQARAEPYVLRWEIRSVNSRYLDLILRLPDNLRFMEPGIRKRVGEWVKRGKVECHLRLEPLADGDYRFELNRALLAAVTAAIQEIDPLLPRAGTVSPLDVARWPGVLKEPEPDRRQLEQVALASLSQALEQLTATRRREGERLAQFIRQRCQALRQQVETARRLVPEALAAIREKLTARIEEICGEPDRDRLEQELVYLAQKLDVTEELDRLATHLDEIERLIGGSGPVGRRLDFLCQEMNREANTLAAKAASTALTQCALEMKVLIEQMREQVQNIE
ncbi:MAG TPA: YicC family protein [Methylothermaceae bacterium]|nr:YicC family protein [Methylothermaceae bacterium]